MRVFVRYVLIIAAVVYVHHAVLPRLLPEPIVPDVTLATVVYLALAVGGVPAIVCGFFLGLISDLFGWGPVGVGAAIGTVAGAVFSYFRGQIYERSLLAPAAFTTIAYVVKQILSFGLLAATSGPVSFGWHVVGRTALGAAATGVAGLAVFFLYWRTLPPRRV